MSDLISDSTSDLISRQAAICICECAIDLWQGQIGSGALIAVRDKIKELPSAQPERVIYASMSDEEFEKWLYEHGICNPNIHESIPCAAVPLLIDYAISELPSAQSERKPGHWEMLSEQSARCTVCGAIRYTHGRDQTLKGHIFYAMYKFCPECGAQMEVEHERHDIQG